MACQVYRFGAWSLPPPIVRRDPVGLISFLCFLYFFTTDFYDPSLASCLLTIFFSDPNTSFGEIKPQYSVVRWNPLSKIGITYFVTVSPMLYHIPSIRYCDSFGIFAVRGLCPRCIEKITSFMFSSSKRKVIPSRWTWSFRCGYIQSLRSDKKLLSGFLLYR